MLAAAVGGARLIRLQCYEGTGRELRRLRVELPEAVAGHQSRRNGPMRTVEEKERHIFGREFLHRAPACCRPFRPKTRRPCCSSTRSTAADEAFEAFLLELLSDFQITVP